MKLAPVWTSILFILTSLIVAGCGKPAPPLPPSLELPKPVADLHAFRKGSKVTLTWSVPSRTTEGETVRYLGPTRICRGLVPDPHQCAKVGEVAPAQLGPKPLARIKKRNTGKGKKRNKTDADDRVQATYVDVLTPDLQNQNATALATYSVETLNEGQRSAGLSNPVQVALAPTLPAPTNLQAQPSANGVTIAWTSVARGPSSPGLDFSYRIYRREQGTSNDNVAGEVPLADSPEVSFTDHGFEWNKTYEYRVTVVTTIAGASPTQVEGDDSTPATVTARDVYPPSVPNGVQAVFSGVGQQPFVDLTWIPSTEADLAGYNIYRHEEGQTPVRINTQPVTSPAFRDSNVVSGKKYFYSVSAIDARGNESDRSAEANESIP
jgi:hypothetical protein